MDVYISKTFTKFVSKNLSNYFIDFEVLSKELKKSFNDNIYIKRPIMKFKIKINWLSYRLVWIVKDNKIVPLLIYLKKDKAKWWNIVWNNELEILVNHYSSKIKKDIDSLDFKIYQFFHEFIRSFFYSILNYYIFTCFRYSKETKI